MKTFTKEDIQIMNEKFTSTAISIYSGQTAFFLMLSFFPFMLFFFSLLNLTPLTETDFLSWAATLIPDSFHTIILGFTQDIYNSSTGRISVTIIAALWLSSKAVVSMQYGLDSMYGIKETRNWLVLRLWGVLYSAVFAIMLIFVLGILVFGKVLRNNLFQNFTAFGHLITFRYLIVIPILFLFFWLSYTVLPNGRHKFRYQIPGAVFSSVGWIVFTWLFSIYANRYCNYASIYGTMTTIALIMVWLYGCMYVIFLGGLFNSILIDKPLQIADRVRSNLEERRERKAGIDYVDQRTNRESIKAVIFDLDGTLIDTEKYYMKAWPMAMEKFGYKMTREQALSMRSLGRPFAPEQLKAISKDPDFDYNKVREYRKELMEDLLDENGIALKPYAKEILTHLRKRGITTALATANDLERTERYLKRVGLYEYIDKIICATMVENGKPAPDIYSYAVKQLKLTPEECIAVEDSPNGVISAAAAGLTTVMIPDLTKPDRKLRRIIYRSYPSLKKFYQDIFC